MYFPAAIVTLCSAALGALGAFLVQRYSNKKNMERDHQNRVWHKKEELYISMINCIESVEFSPHLRYTESDAHDADSYIGAVKIIEEFLDAHMAAIHLYLDDDAPALVSLGEFLSYVRSFGKNPAGFDEDVIVRYISDIVSFARADLGMQGTGNI